MRGIKPKRLKPGDAIGVFALSGPVEPELLDKGIEALESLGFAIRLGANVRKKRGYLAGTDQERADGFNRLVVDPGVRALIAARGGYGCSRVIGGLNIEALRRDPRPVIGCSDLTFLHGMLLEQIGPISIHGPMVASRQMVRLAEDHEAGERLKALLISSDPLPPLVPGTARVLTAGRAEGRLVGGNMTLLVHAVAAGLVSMQLLDSSVLFLEDTNEQGYRLDRMFSTLRLAGVFDRIAGLMLGDFIGEIPEGLVDELAIWAAGGRGIPIVSGFPIGHGEANLPVPMDAIVSLEGGVLTFLEPFAGD